jgi:hypothetical protein
MKKRKKFISKYDKELDTLTNIVADIKSLDRDGQTRVVEYLDQRFPKNPDTYEGIDGSECCSGCNNTVSDCACEEDTCDHCNEAIDAVID